MTSSEDCDVQPVEDAHIESDRENSKEPSKHSSDKKHSIVSRERHKSADRARSSSCSVSEDRKRRSDSKSTSVRCKPRSRRHRRSYSDEADDEDVDRKELSSSRRHSSRRQRSFSRTRNRSRPRHSKSPRRTRKSSSRSCSNDRHDDKKSKRNRRSHSRDKKHRRHRSRSQTKERSSVEKQSTSSRESSIPKRKRRTGWDAAPPAAAGPIPGATNFLPSAITPTTTGFTASLAGRSAEEAASLAASLQLKATASQLCRIYVGSLDYSLIDQDIRQVFSAFGQITSIDMPKEGTRSKGFCFIEYATPESAEMALATMPGFNLKGRAIKVGRPTALGGQAASTLPLANVAKPGGVNAAEAGQIAAAMLLAKTDGQSLGANRVDDAQNRIYVGCIPPNFTADDIKQIFTVFGKILSCQLIPNSEKPGTHRGYGFIEYSTFEEAKLAIETMNNFQIAGKALKVNHATMMRGLNNTPTMIPSAVALMSTGVLPASATGANAVPVQHLLQQTNPLVASALTTCQNIAAAKQLSSVADIASMNNSLRTSSVLLLSDMVDVAEANDELKAEIRLECSKYGKIHDISMALDAARNAVRIFVVYLESKDAAAAVPMLHERWFGGRKIQARLYDQVYYNSGSYWL